MSVSHKPCFVSTVMLDIKNITYPDLSVSFGRGDNSTFVIISGFLSFDEGVVLKDLVSFNLDSILEFGVTVLFINS